MSEDYYRLNLADIQEINRLRIEGQIYTEELEKINRKEQIQERYKKIT